MASTGRLQGVWFHALPFLSYYLLTLESCTQHGGVRAPRALLFTYPGLPPFGPLPPALGLARGLLPEALRTRRLRHHGSVVRGSGGGGGRRARLRGRRAPGLSTLGPSTLHRPPAAAFRQVERLQVSGGVVGVLA